MKENEMESIGFLRRVFATAKRLEMENGNVDAGWSCQEHAVASSMMLCYLGKRAMICQGRVIIGDAKMALNIEPHYFIVIDGKPLKIFDSSITFGTINGIPSESVKVYSDFFAKISTNEPTQDTFLKGLAKSGAGIFAQYGVRTQTVRLPNESMLGWISSAPIGEELNDVLGTQKGFWGKAAYIGAQIYLGDSALEYADLSGPPLWERIAATPDRDKLMASKFKAVV